MNENTGKEVQYPMKRRLPFDEDIKGRFGKWTGIDSKEIDEALRYLTGDTYFEMRKLIMQSLTQIENAIISGQYPGYVKGKKLTDQQRKEIKSIREDLKEAIREGIVETWNGILTKQKIGIDKLGLALKLYLSNNRND